MGERLYTLKFVLVGTSGVGKTQLASRIVRGEYRDNSLPTVGMEFATRPLRYAENASVRAQVGCFPRICSVIPMLPRHVSRCLRDGVGMQLLRGILCSILLARRMHSDSFWKGLEIILVYLENISVSLLL